MDYSRDELRRRLRAADELNREVTPRWRDALQRAFQPGGATDADRRALTGAPSRRGFLRVGGALVAGSAVLAACGNDQPVAETGTTKPVDPSTTTTVGDSPTTQPNPTRLANLYNDNAAVLRTATSLEELAIDLYDRFFELNDQGTIPLDVDVVNAFQLFRNHHTQHADAMRAATVDLTPPAGANVQKLPPYTKPNPYMEENFVIPLLPGLKNQLDVLRFSQNVEALAAGSYVESAGELSKAELRQAVVGIAAAEARHLALVNLLLDQAGAPDPFVITKNRAPDAATIAPDQEAQDNGTATTTTGGS